MQKKKYRDKIIALSMIFMFLLNTITGFSQQVENKLSATAELKHFWKQNELLIGIGSAILFTLIVYVFWKKKKKSITNLDSIG